MSLKNFEVHVHPDSGTGNLVKKQSSELEEGVVALLMHFLLTNTFTCLPTLLTQTRFSLRSKLVKKED